MARRLLIANTATPRGLRGMTSVCQHIDNAKYQYQKHVTLHRLVASLPRVAARPPRSLPWHERRVELEPPSRMPWTLVPARYAPILTKLNLRPWVRQPIAQSQELLASNSQVVPDAITSNVKTPLPVGNGFSFCAGNALHWPKQGAARRLTSHRQVHLCIRA
jgi:hypothetical protein